MLKDTSAQGIRRSERVHVYPKYPWPVILFLLVLAVCGAIFFFVFVTQSKIVSQSKTTLGMAHTDQIVKGCKLYALDHDGKFPGDTEQRTIDTSTEAFRVLSDYLDLGVEGIFWSPGNPEKPKPPNKDGELVPDEVAFSYVKNQGLETPRQSPLVAEEQIAPGVYGKHHPKLSHGTAIVGYCSGQVRLERLSSKKPGATVRGPEGSGIDNIFLPGEWDDEGNHLSGGYLAVPVENVLLPR